mmetsp:Transcript_8657/g.19796  ORF Transcript_8657/g.19796 Transcript_8657/m.19796 type:complete len:201 (-) Transcript_8657:372-974(-)
MRDGVLPAVQPIVQLRHGHQYGPWCASRGCCCCRWSGGRRWRRGQGGHHRSAQGLQEVLEAEAGPDSPLQRVQALRPQDGPPLPLGEQLRRPPQLPVFLPFPLLPRSLLPIRAHCLSVWDGLLLHVQLLHGVLRSVLLRLQVQLLGWHGWVWIIRPECAQLCVFWCAPLLERGVWLPLPDVFLRRLPLLPCPDEPEHHRV